MILLSTFLAGAAALLYEVLWVRLVTLSLGHTAPAVAAVLSAFMGGLALGSWFGGRAADRRSAAGALRLYAWVELAAAAAALASRPVLLAAGAAALRAGITGLSPSWQAAAAFALAASVLSVPAALLGASLPLLVRAGRPGERPDGPLGWLYGANTLGAVGGCLCGGLWLLPTLGLRLTLWTAAALDAVAAGLALSMASRVGERPSEPPAAPVALPRGPALLLAATGAAAMAFETAWTRALALLAGSTTYAFTAVLAAMLTGLALGSLAYARRRREEAVGLAALLAGLALAVTAGLAVYDFLPYCFVKATGGGPAGPVPFAFAGVLIGLPAILMGAVLPWAVALAAPARAGIGKAVGGLYAANTAGAIAGSASAGLVLLPFLGWRGTLAAAAAVYAVCAGALAWSSGRRALGGAAAALALLGPLAARGSARLEASGMFLYGRYYHDVPSFAAFRDDLARDKVLFHETGRNATVTVLESPFGERFLRVNGKTDASEGGDMGTQLLLGYAPLLWGPPAPRRAMVVGLGIGLTAAALATEPSLAAIDVVEIEPAVGRAARLFARSNRAVLDDPRVTLSFADGRQLLAAPGGAYDIIVSEPSNPWIAGIAFLFTREAFALARSRLAPGGVFCQWFHSYHMREQDFRLVLRTFAAVFPHAVLLTNGEADFFLLGSEGPLAPDFARFEAAFRGNASLRTDMARLGHGLDDPFTLLASTFELGEEDLRRWAGEGPLHEDDRPTLETDAPRSFFRASGQPILASLNAAKGSWLPPGTRNLTVHNADLALLFARAAETSLDAEKPAGASGPVEKALRLAPRSSRVWLAYARLLDATGRKPEADAAFHKSTALDPQSADAHARLGIFLYGAGRPKDGKPELEAARRLSPGHALACLGLGWMALEDGDKARAKEVLAEALALPVPDAHLRSDLSDALKKAER